MKLNRSFKLILATWHILITASLSAHHAVKPTVEPRGTYDRINPISQAVGILGAIQNIGPPRTIRPIDKPERQGIDLVHGLENIGDGFNPAAKPPIEARNINAQEQPASQAVDDKAIQARSDVDMLHGIQNIGDQFDPAHVDYDYISPPGADVGTKFSNDVGALSTAVYGIQAQMEYAMCLGPEHKDDVICLGEDQVYCCHTASPSCRPYAANGGLTCEGVPSGSYATRYSVPTVTATPKAEIPGTGHARAHTRRSIDDTEHDTEDIRQESSTDNNNINQNLHRRANDLNDLNLVEGLAQYLPIRPFVSLNANLQSQSHKTADASLTHLATAIASLAGQLGNPPSSAAAGPPPAASWPRQNTELAGPPPAAAWPTQNVDGNGKGGGSPPPAASWPVPDAEGREARHSTAKATGVHRRGSGSDKYRGYVQESRWWRVMPVAGAGKPVGYDGARSEDGRKGY